MIELIEWLSGIEQLAVLAYKQIAQLYEENRKFSIFMDKMAEDEIFHYQAMEKAREFAVKNEIVHKDIIIDETIRDSIEKPLRDILKHAEYGFKTESEIYDLLIQSEFSEWNDIFIYIIRTLAQDGKEFENMLSVIQNHEHRIKDYFASINNSESWLEKIEGLPKLWEHAILIVEDNEPYRELLLDILSDDYRVAGAQDGFEALKELKEHYYDIIISDVDMPEMGGLELFDILQTDNPKIREKFLFMTGDITHEEVFDTLKVKYLFKPVPLETLLETIEEFIHIKIH